MSRPGIVGPLQLERQHATLVGELITLRTAAFAQSTPRFIALTKLGKKLSAGAARKRGHDETRLTLWNIARAEALYGFQYLALFWHPGVPPEFLSVDQRVAA